MEDLPSSGSWFSKLLLLGVALIPSLAWAADLDEARLRERLKSGVLRWGGDAEGGAPYQLRDPQDLERVIGFEVELADALAEVLSKRLKIPLRAEFVQYDWVSLPAGLTESRDFDIAISGMEVGNEEGLLYSRPYYIFKQQLVVRKDEARIQSIEDCSDKSVGTLSGCAADKLLKGLLEQGQIRDIVAFDGQVEPYLDLELGRLDAVLLDAPIALYYAGTNPKLKYAGEPLGKGAYGIALHPEDVHVKAALDQALGELMSSGRLKQIYRKWHLWNDDQTELAEGQHLREELRGMGFSDPFETGSEMALRTFAMTQMAPALPVGLASELLLFPAESLRVSRGPPAADAVDIRIIASSARQWTFDRYFPVLLKAAGMTVFLSVCSMALAMALGLIVCLCRLYGPAPLRWLALGYVEFFRGIPLLLLLFFLYFGLSSYGIAMPAIVTAIVGFGINYAAFEAEIYRSAILSVSPGQWEAAQALGMSGSTTFRRIIFPQALRTALPPMTNDFVALFKDTSLVSVIAVHELTKEYLILSRSSLKFVELGLLTAALYLLMSVPLGYLSRYLERRWGT